MFRVRDVANNAGELYALKRIKGNVRLGQKEAEVWREIGEHPNIVKIVHSEARDTEVLIVNELCTGGTLF